MDGGGSSYAVRGLLRGTERVQGGSMGGHRCRFLYARRRGAASAYGRSNLEESYARREPLHT